jgi:two-component system sensor histidine kinase QseC
MTAAPRHSLQRRLLVLVLGVVSCVWLATATLTWFDARHELDELLDGHLAQAAAILVVQQADELAEKEHHVDAPSLHRYAPKVAFQVFLDGRLVMHSASAPETPLGGANTPFKPGFETVQRNGTTWRVFSAYGNEPAIHIHVGEEVASRASILWAVLRSTLLPMALALPLLALALWWAIHHSVAPIRELGSALARRRPDALEPLAVADAPAELAPMIAALNSLLERVAVLLESERRFTADASHELRTPIAAIRAQAQVALAEADDASRRQALLHTLEGCDRAIRLVDQLLTLSRLEASSTPALQDLDLGALVRQVVADLAPQAVAKGQSLELQADNHCTLPGNATLLAVLVRNLVDNAVRYSPRGARVSVTVHGQSQGVALCVEDSGPGLAEDDRRRLGERFFRVTGSGESGSGLGWSIVRRIAAVHGLRLDANPSTALGGLAVTVARDSPHNPMPDLH